jgi:hypothetical protein
MLELLQRIFLGHNHKWQKIEEINIKYEDVDAYARKIIILKCATCGNLKNHCIKW